MSHRKQPQFPRGFQLSLKPTAAPQSYVDGPILPNFYIHPWTNVDVAGDENLFVISLGHLTMTSQTDVTRPVESLLRALKVSETNFLRTLSTLGGRYAILFGSRGNIRIVNDATAMRSVFYSSQGGVVASHPLLIERALGGKIKKNDLPFRYGYPGNRTPYARTRILTPNTYYWLTPNIIRRFWPVTSPAPVNTVEAASVLLDHSTNALRNIAENRSIKLTLTAGLDSRTVFAIAIHSGVEFTTYTYGDDPATQVDRDIARDLSVAYGIPHTVIPRRRHQTELDQRVAEAQYQPLHHGPWIKPLQDHYADPEALGVLGNLLEIGRSNSSNERRQGVRPPVDAETMAALHYTRMGKARQNEAMQFGLDSFRELSERAFQAFIDDTGFAHQLGNLDPFDQFYWEHRMATWQGYAMGERDFYGLPFIPFNSRNIFETLLGVPKDERHSDRAVYEMIRMVDPHLLDLPINPKRWPSHSQGRR